MYLLLWDRVRARASKQTDRDVCKWRQRNYNIRRKQFSDTEYQHIPISNQHAVSRTLDCTRYRRKLSSGREFRRKSVENSCSVPALAFWRWNTRSSCRWFEFHDEAGKLWSDRNYHVPVLVTATHMKVKTYRQTKNKKTWNAQTLYTNLNWDSEWICIFVNTLVLYFLHYWISWMPTFRWFSVHNTCFRMLLRWFSLIPWGILFSDALHTKDQ